jgi:hypothetical protein
MRLRRPHTSCRRSPREVISRTADDISVSSIGFRIVSFDNNVPRADGYGLHIGNLLVPNRGSFGERAGDGGVQMLILFAGP